jgi:multisubunit Na+/H+ antiporter MnhG subunit
MMMILNTILIIVSYFFYGIGTFILVCCFIGVIRNNDLFVELHAIKIANIYGNTFRLISFLLLNPSLLLFVQIFLLILLNVITNLIVIHSISRYVLNNNIEHSAISRKQYNEKQQIK